MPCDGGMLKMRNRKHPIHFKRDESTRVWGLQGLIIGTTLLFVFYCVEWVRK